MKIVVVGDGKVGYALTEQLAREEHDLTVIDSNASVLKESVESLDVMVVGGNGASLSVLEEDCDVSARLVCNRVSLKTKRERIRGLIDGLAEQVRRMKEEQI